ncbi:MAG: hypothetical protein HY298_15810 [Verrucomicrobia bacterium]|nr:hypothetical protein [Verrucomicrobiota bacterium]
MYHLPPSNRIQEKSIIGLLSFLLLASFSAVAGAEQNTIPAGFAPGTPWIGSRGIQERNADIMARESRPDASATSQRRLPRFRPDFQNLQQNPESPDVASWPAVGSPADGPASPNTPQTLSINFTGATLNDTGAFPPDSMGAAGPSQFVVAVNGRLRTFNKSTGLADGVLNADMDNFFNSVMTPPAANNFTSDPRIRYDRLSGRWIVIIIDVPGQAGNLPNRVLIAVSNGGVLTSSTVWTFFFFQHDLVSPAGDTGEFADYPTLGVDANALYIGVNLFGSRGLRSSFANTTAFVVRKSSVLGAGPIVVTAFRDLIPHGNSGGPFTPQGVDNYDPAATEGYFIGVNSRFYGLLELRRVSDPGGTPLISDNIDITIPLNGATINVPHLGNTGGTAGYLDGLDYRLLAAHFRNGRLWTSENIAVDNTGASSGTDTRMAVRWYELQGIATGQTPSLLQSGTVFQPSAGNTTDQRNYWMGTVMVSGQGHAAMGFSLAGANERINAGTVGRLAGDPLGTTQTPVLYTASASDYNPPSDPGGSSGRRWGDYSYTSLDPADDMTMWTIQEFCNAQNSYAVQVVKLLAPPPATPASCNPPSLSAGSSNISVAVTGNSVSGSGFYDPGNGFSNRLSAIVNGGGITVASVTFNNPTNVTLNLSVSPAAPIGARTITVTNPDGQSATSSTGILTILSSNNTPPVISSITNQSTLEDIPTSLIAFTVSDTETPAVSLTLSASSSNTNLVPGTNIVFGGAGSNRTVTITPAPDQNGTATITITVTDTNGGTASDNFALTVIPVNDAPSFVKGADQSVPEDSGAQTVTGWATAISAGPPDESSQILDFVVTNDSPALFSTQPSIASNGTLTFAPATNANGTATLTVQLHDNGGTNNGGSDTSPAQTFTITVTPVNNAPVLTPIPDQIMHAQSTLTITNTATDVDLPQETLTFSLTNAPNGATMNPTNGLFTWTPTDDQSPATNIITVVVTDDGTPPLSDAKSFTVTVVTRPLVSISRTNDSVTLTWTAIAGKTYRVQYKTNLDDLTWNDLSGDVTAISDTATKLDIIDPETQRFYRVSLVP